MGSGAGVRNVLTRRRTVVEVEQGQRLAGKFQIRSRKWNIASVVGVIVLFALGFGGLVVLPGSNPSGTTLLVFLVSLGVLTFLFFTGPGLLYSGRKRIKFLKAHLPGGTMAWIRSHMYLPVFAIAAAFVHATAAPFRNGLSSGKVLLTVAVLVVISGTYRHKMIGLQKEALNVDVEISKLSIGQPKAFRLLVAEFTDGKKPLAELEADVAKMAQPQQVLWREVKRLSSKVEKNFPRSGGQRARVLQYKMWKALHPPLTVGLFVILAFHVGDTLGAKNRVFHDDKVSFASTQQCAGCHSRIVDEFSTSAMAHAQTSSIMKAQLPVTLAKNEDLVKAAPAEQKVLQQDRFDRSARTCLTCHAQVGAQLTSLDDKTILLPINQKNSASDGGVALSGSNDAGNIDGVGCIVCHTQDAIPPELSAAGPINVSKSNPSDYGNVFGPLLTDPKSLPVRVHSQRQSSNNDAPLWQGTARDSLAVRQSLLCGACHDVKIDMNGNGSTSKFADAKTGIDEASARVDSNGDLQLDQNDLEKDPLDPTGKVLSDLVLQTTYDEWEDYVVGFKDADFNKPAADGKVRNTLTGPLGCTECHMPAAGKKGLVDHAPGLASIPSRDAASHTFVGVDYDLADGAYKSKEELDNVLAERQALVGSAASLAVTPVKNLPNGDPFVTVTLQNNLLGHTFPTGFAFARQWWLEVSAKGSLGTPLCLEDLSSEFKAQCSSGTLKNPTDDLPQCDPASVFDTFSRKPELFGQPFKADQYGDKDIVFAATQPVGQCDPWLANFQKILTDGGVTTPGKFTEVPYQSFLLDIVKTRTRVASNSAMVPLESLRRKVDGAGNPVLDANGRPVDLSQASFDYFFKKANLKPGEVVVVSATLHLRHIPPDFLKGLATDLNALKRVPADAKIDPAALLKNLVVTDVVKTDSTKLDATIACLGPQNEAGRSILSCIPEQKAGQAAGAVRSPGVLPVSATLSDPAADIRRNGDLMLAILACFSLATAILRRRLVPSRRHP